MGAKKPFIPYSTKATNLLLYRQYNTYQVLLEAHPINNLSVEGCFSKIILYVMDWFKNRIGNDNLEKLAEIAFLNKDYPKPDSYADFDISTIDDINSLSVVDVKTSYMEDKAGWVFQLVEPDNGNENKDINGRVFTTNICVYKKDESVVFGVRTSCREPNTNTEDADVYRPAFVRTIFIDEDIELCEEGIASKYHFGTSPIILNGKSTQECKDIYDGLIANPHRQLPILFLPCDICFDGDDVSEWLKKKINGITRSYLGFCHVIAWKKSCQKLFGLTMNQDELREVAEEGSYILYRSNPGRDYVAEPSYFDEDEEPEVVSAGSETVPATVAETATETKPETTNEGVNETESKAGSASEVSSEVAPKTKPESVFKAALETKPETVFKAPSKGNLEDVFGSVLGKVNSNPFGKISFDPHTPLAAVKLDLPDKFNIINRKEETKAEVKTQPKAEVRTEAVTQSKVEITTDIKPETAAEAVSASTPINVTTKKAVTNETAEAAEPAEEKETRFESLERIIKKADPLRRKYDFGEYYLTADRWNPERVLLSLAEGVDDSEEKKLLKLELDRIKAALEDADRDREAIQARNNEYVTNNRELERQRNEAYAAAGKAERSLDEARSVAKEAVNDIKRLSSENEILTRSVSGYVKSAKEEYAPLLNMPSFESGTVDDTKEAILEWIELYYSETIIIHDRARRAFLGDKRNLDWRLFCLMIHYLAGYTIRRNNGGTKKDENPLREYDPEDNAFSCEPTSSGSSGAAVIHKDKYTINVSEFDSEEGDVILDYHIKQGKGRGDDMIRIYFWYDSRIKKTIIGYMPDHLPTRKDSH